MKDLVKCIDCQFGGNKYKKGTYICYNVKSTFWFKEVLNAISRL